MAPATFISSGYDALFVKLGFGQAGHGRAFEEISVFYTTIAHNEDWITQLPLFVMEAVEEMPVF